MSEWFKEHDWKSCDGGESSAGSNPVLCAMRMPPLGAFFHGVENSLLGMRIIAGAREATRAIMKFAYNKYARSRRFTALAAAKACSPRPYL